MKHDTKVLSICIYLPCFTGAGREVDGWLVHRFEEEFISMTCILYPQITPAITLGQRAKVLLIERKGNDGCDGGGGLRAHQKPLTSKREWCPD